ncbi:hypothetical protein [Daejeonella sp.]|uniref:hypothetical protein n=1 Tax=Daejeonella sp. TaxID=2805397 RepID=UPI0030BD0052
MGIKNKPYNLLLYCGLLLLIISFFVTKPYGELNLSDTYFITPLAPFIQFAAGILITIWIIYLFTARFLNSIKLTWIHVLLTLAGAVTFIISITTGMTTSVGIEGSTIESTGFTVSILSPVILAVPGQLLYFINLALGLFRK